MKIPEKAQVNEKLQSAIAELLTLPEEKPRQSGERINRKVKISLPGVAHELALELSYYSENDRWILALGLVAAGNRHSTTHYLQRGSREDILRFFSETTDDKWYDIISEQLQDADRFYYP